MEEEESEVYKSIPRLLGTGMWWKHLPPEVPRGYRIPVGRREGTAQSSCQPAGRRGRLADLRTGDVAGRGEWASSCVCVCK